MSRPRLAVIVPAYDEEVRLPPTLRRLAEFFAGEDYEATVVVVSDGSTDQTNQIVLDFAKEHPSFQLLSYEPNKGKGYAVRRGMLESDADYILFSDADLAAPIEEITKLWKAVEGGADIAIGSRPLKESNLVVRQPWFREMCGRAFNKAVQTLAVRGIDDTQCGFKLFRNEVAKDVFQRCKLNGFGFDFESLMIARDLNYKIAEVPIAWSHQEGSKVSLVRDGLRMLRELVKLNLAGKKKRLSENPDAI